MVISKVDIQFGMAVQGPFKLSDGISVRRVSLILWLCIQQHGFSKMLIPHFLDLSTEDADTYLKFLKADVNLRMMKLNINSNQQMAEPHLTVLHMVHFLRGIFASHVYPSQFFLMSAPDTTLVVA